MQPRTVVAAMAIRLVLFVAELDTLLSGRPELVTPLTSIRRLKESSFLVDAGHSMYAGDQFHRPPLVLTAYRALTSAASDAGLSPRIAVIVVLFLSDFVTAIALRSLSQRLLLSEEEPDREAKIVAAGEAADKALAALDSREKLGRRFATKGPGGYLDFRNTISVLDGPLCASRLPDTVASAYLLHPFTMLTCGALSTAGISHMIIALLLLSAARGHVAASGVLLGLATYVDIYPAVLLLPVAGLVSGSTSTNTSPQPVSKVIFDALRVGAVTLAVFIGLLFLSRTAIASQPCKTCSAPGHSWGFLWPAYGRVWEIADLTPNVGIFWYFFTEIFDRFREYFLLVLHVHPFIYVAPLAIQFVQRRPAFLAFMLVAIFALFRPFPALCDIGFTSCLLLVHPRTLQRMRGLFELSVGMLLPVTMLPWMWYVWLHTGSGNANYFYFQTLVYNMAAALFVLEALTATIKRDRLLKHNAKAIAANKEVKETEETDRSDNSDGEGDGGFPIMRKHARKNF